MKNVLVCLHGWGGSKESFDPLQEALQGADVLVLAPDLPGFGQSPDPETPYTIDDYANWVTTWLQEQFITLNIPADTPISLLGHSHGGRICIALAYSATKHATTTPALPLIDHLYLCASAGVYHPQRLRKAVFTSIAKTGAFVLKAPGLRTLAPLAKKCLYKVLGVHDYERANPIMQRTMQLVTQQDLTPLLQHIQTPTDVFWGTEDTQTPLSDGTTMAELLPNATLHTYPGVRHAVHKVKAVEIAGVIKIHSTHNLDS